LLPRPLQPLKVASSIRFDEGFFLLRAGPEKRARPVGGRNHKEGYAPAATSSAPRGFLHWPFERRSPLRVSAGLSQP
jgi:hypothetical protein